MVMSLLAGRAKVNDDIEIPSLKLIRKIKSIQRFKQSTQAIMQGDRAGICVPNVDAKLIERSLISTPKSVKLAYALVTSISIIPYFCQPIKSRSRFHVTVGNATVIASILVFRGQASGIAKEQDKMDFEAEYQYLPELSLPTHPSKQLSEPSEDASLGKPLCLMHLETPVLVVDNSLVIASRLDQDINQNKCRLAFYSKVLHIYHDKNYNKQIPRTKSDLQKHQSLSTLLIYKEKVKTGVLERPKQQVLPENGQYIVRNLFKKQTDITRFISYDLKLSTGERAQILSKFG